MLDFYVRSWLLNKQLARAEKKVIKHKEALEKWEARRTEIVAEMLNVINEYMKTDLNSEDGLVV